MCFTMPCKCSVLLVDALATPQCDRERTAEVMFEILGVVELYLSNRAVLTLHGYGRTTGLSVNFGNEGTTVAPVYKGYLNPHTVVYTNIGGSTVTARLKQRGYSFYSAAEEDTVRILKEEAAYVALNHTEAAATLQVGTELYECTEILFQHSYSLTGSSDSLSAAAASTSAAPCTRTSC